MSATLPWWAGPLVALFSTALLLRGFARVARRIGLVDEPDHRKVHARATPLVGGLAIFGGLVFGLLAVPTPLAHYRIMFGAAAALLLVGLLDDLHELSPRSRFVAQILAALSMIVFGGVMLADFGPLLSTETTHLGLLAIPITVFSTVGVINAVNMVDGVDGLAGGLLLIAVLGLLAVGWTEPEAPLQLLACCAGSLFAFLLYNFRWRRRAKVFLGDAGSLCLGFILAWLVIELSQGPARMLDPVTALWLLAVPLLDTVFVMVERLRARRSPFAAGHDHVHHLFLRAGFSPRLTVLILWLAALVLAAAGLVAQMLSTPQHLRFYAFLGLALAYYLVVRAAWTRRRWLGRTVAKMSGT